MQPAQQPQPQTKTKKASSTKVRMTKDQESALMENYIADAKATIRIRVSDDVEEQMSEETLTPAIYESISKILLCVVCQEIIKHPVAFKDCLHVFCSECLNKLMKQFQDSKKCPTCNNQVQTTRSIRQFRFLEPILNLIYREIGKTQENREALIASEVKRQALRREDLRNRNTEPEISEESRPSTTGSMEVQEELQEVKLAEEVKSSEEIPQPLRPQESTTQVSVTEPPTVQKPPAALQPASQSTSRLPAAHGILHRPVEEVCEEIFMRLKKTFESHPNYKLLKSKGFILEFDRNLLSFPMQINVCYEFSSLTQTHFPRFSMVQLNLNPASPFELIARVLAKKNGHPAYFGNYKFSYATKQEKKLKMIELRQDRLIKSLYSLENRKVGQGSSCFTINYLIADLSEEITGLKHIPMENEEDFVQQL